jgi:hypothetical protein
VSSVARLLACPIRSIGSRCRAPASVVQSVRDGDCHETGRVHFVLPNRECLARIFGTAVVDLGGADGAQPGVAAGSGAQ